MKTKVAFAALISILLAGCFTPKYGGGKIVDGMDIAVGFALPVSDGTWQIDLLNYLSGYRFSFQEGSAVACEYEFKSTTSFCGIYENTTVKKIKVGLNPKVDEPLDKTEDNAEDVSEGECEQGSSTNEVIRAIWTPAENLKVELTEVSTSSDGSGK